MTHYISHKWIIGIGFSHKQLDGGEDCGNI